MQKQKSCIYHSVTPANNMVLKRKWDEKLYNVHRSRVRLLYYYTRVIISLLQVENAKPIIDDHPPSIQVHLHLNLRKVQKEQVRINQRTVTPSFLCYVQQRQALIDRENQLLLERISHIMRTSGNRTYNKYESKRYEFMQNPITIPNTLYNVVCTARSIIEKY